MKYSSVGPWRSVIVCHCTQCRRTSGHIWAATAVPNYTLRIEEEVEGALVWYQSSETARRGFCRLCGSSLFYDKIGESTVSIAAGSLDGDTGLRSVKHIFVAEKGDYYEIADDLPQHEN
ncbi:MAG: GFA family protein [Pseudomonadota bacterium]